MTSTHPPVLVLGMHRSGTSCLAASLEEAGLFLGEVNRKARFNAKGNHENRDVMDLNDRVLASVDAAWDSPPDGAVPWPDAQKAERDALLRTYPSDRIWGFKEPRTVLTLEGWLEALPGARLVGTVRHPLAVAASLTKRNKWDTARGLALWQAYNVRLLPHDMPFVDFDAPPEVYAASVARLAGRLGLTPPDRFAFFDEALRRNAAPPDGTLPPEIARTYDALRDRLV